VIYPGSKHVNMQAAGGLNPNLNIFIDCHFFNLGAAQTSCSFSDGAGLYFLGCDWSAMGRAVSLTNMDQVTFDTCYDELLANVTLPSVGGASGFRFDGPTTYSPVMVRNHISRNSSTTAVFGYTTGTKIVFDGCKAGFYAVSQFFLVNTGTGSHAIPGDGTIQLINHGVSGNATDPTVSYSGVAPGVLTPRAWAIVNTAGAGTIVDSSDPNLGLNRLGVGDMVLNWSMPVCSAAAKQCVTVTGQNSVAIGFGNAAQATRFQCGTRAAPNTLVDDIAMVMVYGK